MKGSPLVDGRQEREGGGTSYEKEAALSVCLRFFSSHLIAQYEDTLGGSTQRTQCLSVLKYLQLCMCEGGRCFEQYDFMQFVLLCTVLFTKLFHIIVQTAVNCVIFRGAVLLTKYSPESVRLAQRLQCCSVLCEKEGGVRLQTFQRAPPKLQTDLL